MLRPLLTLLVIALPVYGERVRVVVAVREAELAVERARPVRQEVIDSLPHATSIEAWGDGPVFEMEIERSAIEALRLDPRVQAVEIDEGGTAALLQSVPLIGGDVAASHGFDGTGATVAVIDSGLDRTHASFGGRVVDEQCFCMNSDSTGCCVGAGSSASGQGSAADDNGHGTHVAAIVAGDGTASPRGLAPGARLVGVKVLNSEGKFASFTEIHRALEWVLTAHPEVRVINMSLGSFALYEPEQCAASAVALGLAPVIAQLRDRGAVITASSGNQGSTTAMAIPACMDGVLAVGATYDAAGDYAVFCPVTGAVANQVACFSNSSASLDLLAPGAPILSAWPGGRTRTMHGTSMAAPHVAGVVAMMLEASGGALTAAEIEQTLMVTGTLTLDHRNGLTIPRLDAAAALANTPRPVRRRGVRH